MKHEDAVVDERSVEIKVVGKSGQISLGKRYAGKALRVERRGDGTVLLTAVAMIPEHQLWTMEEPDRSQIQQGLRWAARTAAAETDVESLSSNTGKPRKPVRRARGRQR